MKKSVAAINLDTGLPHTTGDRRIAWRPDLDGSWKLFTTPPPAGGGFVEPDVLYDLTDPNAWEEFAPVIPVAPGDPNFALYASKITLLKADINGLYNQ